MHQCGSFSEWLLILKTVTCVSLLEIVSSGKMYRIWSLVLLALCVDSSAVNRRLSRLTLGAKAMLGPVENQNKAFACLALTLFILDYGDAHKLCNCVRYLGSDPDSAWPHLMCLFDLSFVASLYIPYASSTSRPMFPAHKCYIKDIGCIYSVLIPLYIAGRLIHHHPALRESRPLLDLCLVDSVLTTLTGSRMILAIKTLVFVAQHYDRIPTLYYDEDDHETYDPPTPQQETRCNLSLYQHLSHNASVKYRCQRKINLIY